jgi:hypothetical protein
MGEALLLQAAHDCAHSAQSWKSIRHPQRDVLLEADVARLFSVPTAGRTATAGMTNPSGRMSSLSGGMSNPGGGMSNPGGGMSNPGGGMSNPSAGMSNPPARMSSTPMMPAVAAAPADARSEVLVAPVPAGAVPTVVIPAVIVTEPNELRALDYIQAVGRASNRSRYRAAPTLAPMIDKPPTKTVATAIVTANLCMMISLSSIDRILIT